MRRPGCERSARSEEEKKDGETDESHGRRFLRKQRPGQPSRSDGRSQIQSLQVKGPLLRGFLLALGRDSVPVRHCLSYAVGAARPCGQVRERRQSGHAGLRQRRDRARERRGLRRGRDPARHAGRAQHVDAEDLQGGARVEDPGDRLRLARGRPRCICRRLDRPGGGPPRDGAADEHRLLDADQRRRRRHPEGPAAQGRQRRRRIAPRARTRRTAETSSGPTPPSARRRT